MQIKPERKTTETGPEVQDAEAIVRGNISWMLTLAERILRDRHLAEDAVQDAFLNMFRGLRDFENRSDLKTWLHRITVNASLTKLRQVGRLKEQNLGALLPEFDHNGCRVEAPWSYLAPLEEVVSKERLRRVVIDGVNALPDTHRIVLQLRDIEGYSTREVASLCDVVLAVMSKVAARPERRRDGPNLWGSIRPRADSQLIRNWRFLG